MIEPMTIDDTTFAQSTLPPGMPLDEGEVYLDLANPELGPFRALHGQVAGTKNRYLAQADTPPGHWDQLVRGCAAASCRSQDETLLPTPEFK